MAESVERDLIPHEEVEMWTVDALKDYCRRRGYKVTRTKKELVSRVYVLYNNDTPEQPGAKEIEATRKHDYQGLYKLKCPSPDPFKISSWRGEKDAITKWPPVSYVDIHCFMSQHSVGLSREAMTAYKTGKAFSYYSCDWLREVLYSPITRNHECCYLKTACVPSNRINDIPHSLWVKCYKKTGEIVSAYCSCVAGLSQTCNHVAALLFKVEAAFKLDLSNPSCTSALCAWSVPTSPVPRNIKLREMEFAKPDYSKGKGPTLPLQLQPLSHAKEQLIEYGDPQFYKDFIADLKDAIPNASLFIPGKPADVKDHEVETHQHMTDLPTIAMQCTSVRQLLEQITFSKKEVSEVERMTVGQAKNELWCRMRLGRLMASNFIGCTPKSKHLNGNLRQIATN